MSDDIVMLSQVNDSISIEPGDSESIQDISGNTVSSEIVANYNEQNLGNNDDLLKSSTDVSEQNTIIIPDDGIVFSEDTLLITSDRENKNISHDHTECNDAPDFTIKVETKPSKSLIVNTDYEGINRHNNLHDNITFVTDNCGSDEYQSTIDINSVESLQKLCNKNIFISQAAISGDNKTEQILTDKTDDNDLSNDNKGFLREQSLENSLFIKDETDISNLVKTESDANTIYHPVVFIQIENSDGTPQLIELSDSTQVIKTTETNNTNNSNGGVKHKRKRKYTQKRKKPYQIIPKTVSLQDKLSDHKIYIGGKALPMIAPKGHRPFNSKAFKFNMGLLMGEGEYFEVLGRCIQCFRSSRTTAFCRANRKHREAKASTCADCEPLGHSTLVCRRKLNHKADNALPINIVINTAIQQPEHVRQLCIKNNLPPCFSELQSITVHHAEVPFVSTKNKNPESNTESSETPHHLQRKPVEYARGYLYPYSKEKWIEWLDKFCKQTSTEYRVRTGKRVNKKTDHGLANHNTKIVSYRTLETQLYNCALGGKPRKRLAKQGVRKRSERRSKLIGCTAALHTRLIVTETNWTALEITAPKLSAHLSSHDPRITKIVEKTSDFIQNVDDLILVSSNVLGENTEVDSRIDKQQVVDNTISSPSAQQLRFDFIPIADNINETDFKKDALGDEKKHVKNMLLTCADMIDMIENEEVLLNIQDNTQTMLSKVLGELNTLQTTKPLLFTKQLNTTKKSEDFTEDVVVEGVSQIDEISHMISQVE